MADKPTDFIDQYQALVRDGLAAWSRQFDPGDGSTAEPPSADIMGRMFAGLGGYGDWMRAFSAGEGVAASAGGPAASPFAAGMPGMGAGMHGLGMPGMSCGAPFGYGPPPGGGPFGYGPPPGASAPPGSPVFNDWAQIARESLSLPAFGLTREQQEEQQALLRAWIDCAEHYQRYQTLLEAVRDRATAALREEAPPTDAESMRSVYDRWVNLAEASYGEAALSQEFRDVYAALVDAQMRLKRLQQKQVERWAVQAGMPTRTEVDSLGERLQAVRRELRHLQGVAAEVDALKAEIAGLRDAAAAVPASASAPAPKPKAPAPRTRTRR